MSSSSPTPPPTTPTTAPVPSTTISAVTLDDPATGAVHASLIVYDHCAEFDPTPELYTANAKPVATLTTKGKLNITAPIPLYFCVERDDAAGDPYIYQPRGKISLANVFISETPVANVPPAAPDIDYPESE